MPATDFGWSLNEKPPIFQVYGTKRKCSNLPTDKTEMVEDTPKRRCLAMRDTDSVTMETQHVTVPDHCLHRCSPHQIPTAQSHQPMCSPQEDDMLSSHYTHLENNNNNNNIPSLEPVFHTQSHHMVSHRTSQGNMVAGFTESGGHVVCQEHSLHASVTNMEAEDTPSAPQQHQQQGLSYCDNFCVGGDISPRSHRVRCYCIPSWEGLMDDRQYMSDYY